MEFSIAMLTSWSFNKEKKTLKKLTTRGPNCHDRGRGPNLKASSPGRRTSSAMRSMTRLRWMCDPGTSFLLPQHVKNWLIMIDLLIQPGIVGPNDTQTKFTCVDCCTNTRMVGKSKNMKRTPKNGKQLAIQPKVSRGVKPCQIVVYILTNTPCTLNPPFGA